MESSAINFYSQQRGLRSKYDLIGMRKQLIGVYNYFRGKNYFAEWEGYACVDGADPYPNSERSYGWVSGTAGTDVSAWVFAMADRDDLFPIDPVNKAWTEDQVFDAIQLLGSVVSKPTRSHYHDWSNCGTHAEEFSHVDGLREYRDMINKKLALYGDGWELRADLSMAELPPNGLAALVNAELPSSIDEQSRQRVDDAIEKYRRRGSTAGDRRDAVRDLGDVLELYRKKAEPILGATESDLFNILNNFGLRHNNAKQKTDYDPIFLSGVFYHCLNMINVLAHKLAVVDP